MAVKTNEELPASSGFGPIQLFGFLTSMNLTSRRRDGHRIRLIQSYWFKMSASGRLTKGRLNRVSIY